MATVGLFDYKTLETLTIWFMVLLCGTKFLSLVA